MTIDDVLKLIDERQDKLSLIVNKERNSPYKYMNIGQFDGLGELKEEILERLEAEQ